MKKKKKQKQKRKIIQKLAKMILKKNKIYNN